MGRYGHRQRATLGRFAAALLLTAGCSSDRLTPGPKADAANDAAPVDGGSGEDGLGADAADATSDGRLPHDGGPSSADAGADAQADDDPVPAGHYDPPEIPGYSSGPCTAPPSETAAFDAQTAMGFSGADLLARFNAGAHGTLTWADGTTTFLNMQVSYGGGPVRYDDYPRDMGLCVPSMSIRDVSPTLTTTDGLMQATDALEFSLSGQIDGADGIGMMWVSGPRLDPAMVTHSSVEKAAAQHPEHDARYLRLQAHLSPEGAIPYCIRGDFIDDDPLAPCHRYDGVLLYVSHPSDLFEDHHNIDTSQLFEAAIAWWTWDEMP